MKKILLSAVAIMAFGVAAQAQDMKFGVKAGVNFANLGGDAETSGSRTGFHVGGLAEFKLSEQFSIQPELVYSMQGAKEEILGEEFDVKYDYLNIPIMAKYYLMEGLSLHAGPQIGFLMSAKADDEDIKDGTNSIDFGIAGGAEYELSMGVFFQARYYAGLSNTYDGEDSDDYKAPNNVISLSVGYKF